MLKEFIIVGIVFFGLVFLGIYGLNEFYKSQKLQSCTVFGIEANRTTKYVEYTHWNVDCLTLTEDGDWISAYNLRDK